MSIKSNKIFATSFNLEKLDKPLSTMLDNKPVTYKYKVTVVFPDGELTANARDLHEAFLFVKENHSKFVPTLEQITNDGEYGTE